MHTIGIESVAEYHESSKIFHGSLKNIMGTRLDALIINKGRWESQEIWNDIVFELRRLDRIFNRFDEKSEVSFINRSASDGAVLLSNEMWSVLQSCKDYNSRTLGLFDVTLHDFNAILLNNETQTVTFSKDDISLDFGGYAKGYALGKIKEIMHQAEVKQSYVDFGNSSIMAIGHHPYGDSWKVSVENPYQPDVVLDILSICDQAISISGNTLGYTGHIVCPVTGEALIERKMVSIISDNPLDAEVLSTVFMIADLDEKEQIKRVFNVQIIAEYKL